MTARPNTRSRFTFRRLALGAIVAVLVLFWASRHWYVRYAAGDRRTVVMIWLGGIETWRAHAADTTRSPGFTSARIPRNRGLRTSWGFYANLRGARGWHVTIPIWMFALIPAAPLVFVAWRDRARRRRGLCGSCGYDLAGNTTGTCPECGTAVPRRVGIRAGSEGLDSVAGRGSLPPSGGCVTQPPPGPFAPKGGTS